MMISIYCLSACERFMLSIVGVVDFLSSGKLGVVLQQSLGVCHDAAANHNVHPPSIRVVFILFPKRDSSPICPCWVRPGSQPVVICSNFSGVRLSFAALSSFYLSHSHMI